MILLSLDLSSISAALSVIVAVLALVYSYVQSNVKKYEIKRDFRQAILMWFSETTKILLQLRFLLVYSPDRYSSEKSDLMALLSTQIEVGRLYFPNIDKGDGFGDEKPKAFRGYRNLTLDFLVFSFNIFLREDAKQYAEHLYRLQREFTSIICETIDPKVLLNETKKHTDIFFNHNMSYEEFLDKDPANRDLFFPNRPE